MKKSFFGCFVFLLLAAFSAHAELSTNPWIEPNTAEDIAEVYNHQKGVKASQNASENMAKTYTKIPESGSSGEGFFDKVKNMFKSEDKSETVQASVGSSSQARRVAARRRSMSGRKKTANRRRAPTTDDGGMLSGFEMPSGDLSGVVDKVKGFNLKSLTKAFK